MKNLHLFSIFLCLVGILAPVLTQPTKKDRDVISELAKKLGDQLKAGHYKSIYDLMGAGATVTVNNKIFSQTRKVSNRDDFAEILNAYKSFAPISLAKTDSPVYISTSDHFKVKIGAELGLKFNPYGVPIRLESVLTFKKKTPKLQQVQSATLTIHLKGK